MPGALLAEFFHAINYLMACYNSVLMCKAPGICEPGSASVDSSKNCTDKSFQLNRLRCRSRGCCFSQRCQYCTDLQSETRRLLHASDIGKCVILTMKRSRDRTVAQMRRHSPVGKLNVSMNIALEKKLVSDQ